MTSSAEVSFSAVVATAGRPQLVREALRSLMAADPAPTEIIVVDGDATRSAEPVVRDVAGEPRAVRYVSTERGLTKQRNHALKICRGDVVAFFDDDARVEPDVFARLARAYADPGVVGATGFVDEPASNRVGGKESKVRRLLPGAGPQGRFTRYGYPNRIVDIDVARDVEFMQGCFMTARTDAARAVGFDEHLPGYGLAEDEDFSYRLSRLGRIRYEPAAVVHHDNTGFGTRDTRTFGHQVVGNRAYLLEKNFSPTPTVWAQFGLLLVVLVAHRLLNRDARGALGLIEGALRLPSRSRPDSVRSNARPRVAFVSSHAQLGGSERYLERLLTHLDDEVVAGLALLADGPFAARAGELAAQVTTIPTGASWRSMLAGAGRLRSWLRLTGANVVHANGVKAALVATLATVGSRTPVVWVKHDFSWDGRLAQLIAKRSQRVIGVSRAVVEGLPAAVVDVVPPGIDVPPVDRAAARRRVEARVGGEGPFLVLVGRLHPVKGHTELLAAVPTLVARHEALRVVFVGDEDPSQREYAADIRERAAVPALREHVVFAGHIDDAVDVIAGADVLVVPSVRDPRGMGREGFGLTALEAMAVGTPVVGYDDGGLPEVVGPCARLVPPGDRTALAQALLTVLERPQDREALVACGCDRVATEFTTDRWVGAMLAHYEVAARR